MIFYVKNLQRDRVLVKVRGKHFEIMENHNADAPKNDMP